MIKSMKNIKICLKKLTTYRAVLASEAMVRDIIKEELADIQKAS